VTKDWNEQSRYSTHPEKDAEDLFRAITDRHHGVLKWIRSQW
jgi:hypothetical protein